MEYAYIFLSIIFGIDSCDKIAPELRMSLNCICDDERISVIVCMAETYPFREVEYLPVKEKARIFKQVAWNSQQQLIHYLTQSSEKVEYVKPFWVFNGLHIKATRHVIEQIAQRRDVAYICTSGTVTVADFEAGISPGSRIAEWNIQRVMADSCWYAGFTGNSILVGLLGTGCDFNHPAMQGKWSGYWHDFVNNQPNPYDDNGHGTFNAGIICGGDGLGPFADDIGIAPGVKMVVAKCFDQNGSGTYELIDLAMQWMADLKVDSGVDIRTVSNPWGITNTTELHWWDICNTWKSLRMLGVFPVGGQGPGAGTVCTPANYPLVMGIGATDAGDDITSFSARGPAPDQNPWNDSTNWYRPDWNLTKPDIVAPGVNIRSCHLNNTYQTWSGTNMASSHEPGAIAILCEANPDLIPVEIYNLLLDYAYEPLQGAPYPNNNYGWGRLNIWSSLQAAIGVNENLTMTPPHLISLFPNPTTGTVKIDFPAEKDAVITISMHDIEGRTILTKQLNGQPTLALPDRLPSGVYFVEIKTRKLKVLKKLTLLR